MSMITESALFKACVEAPRSYYKVSDLNLDKIKEPQDAATLPEEEITSRKAVKLYHMAWSGITKSLKSICVVRQRTVELPGFGILVPWNVTQGIHQQKSRLTSGALGNLEDEVYDVKLFAYNSFIDSCSQGAQRSGLLEVFDPTLGEIQECCQNPQ